MNIDEKYENKITVEESQPELGMNWFKFLIYFLMFLRAAEDLMQAAAMIFNIKNEIFDFDYYFIGSLRWLGILFAVAFGASAFAGIYLRFALAKFKKGAPKKYIIFEIATQALLLIYNIAGILTDTSIKADELLFTAIGLALGTILSGVIFIYPSMIYFKKRNHLFVN